MFADLSLEKHLELFDGEFLALREERKGLIDAYKHTYEHNGDQRKSFDVARLLAFLEATRSGLSWREAEENGRPFAVALADSCVEALKDAAIGTPSSLKRVLNSPRFRYALKSFAISQGIAPAEVSHLATIVLAVIVKKLSTVQHQFPNLMFDPALTSMVQRRALR